MVSSTFIASPGASGAATSLKPRSAWRRAALLALGLQLVACAALAADARWGGLLVLIGFAAGSVLALLLSPPVPALFAFFVVLAALGNAAGWAAGLYDRLWAYDDAMHLGTAFAVIGAAFSVLLRAGALSRPSPVRAAGLGALAGLVIGLGWELLEAPFLDLTWPDTLGDLALDVLGGGLGALLALRQARAAD